MIDVVQQFLFDYASLDADTREFVQEKAQAIHTRLKRTAEDIIAIGQDLIEVKGRLPDMKFSAWLRAEFDMSRPTAYRFISVATRFGNSRLTVRQLSAKVLYELASPSMPDTVIEMVETQQIPASIPAIREAKQEAQAANTGHGISELYSRSQGNPTLYTIPVDESEEEKDYQWLYNPETHEAYCKYCYKIHRLWEHFHDVFPGEHVWECQVCQHRTKDEYMQIEGGGIILPPVEIDRMNHNDYPLPGTSGRNVDNIPLAVPHISSKNNEWYTPVKYVAAARLLMGAIDLDPASCAIANETIQATDYYDIHTNGLDKDWTGSVWLNPPYGYTNGRSNQDVWSGRLIDQFKNKVTTEAVLLVNAAVDTTWFQRLFAFPVCLTLGRINFTTPESTLSGSTHGSAFVYFGPQPDRFFEIFSEFGTVVRRW